MATNQIRYPGLDALRGIAILLVLFYHYFPFFRIGWIGVDLFFVMSGFLITTGLLNTRGKQGYFRNFFAKRILRIFPLYFLVLGLFYAICPFAFAQKQSGSVFDYYTHNSTWFWAFAENWLFVKKGVPPEPFLQHFWSLAVEEQFYIIWPFVICGIKNLRHLKIFLATLFFTALSFRIFIWLYPYGHEAFYYSTFSRMDSLAAGAFLAVLFLQHKKMFSYQTLAAAIALSLVIGLSAFSGNLDHNSAWFATIGYSVAAVFFMCCCGTMIHSKSAFARNQFLRFTGQISYGIYVYHLPVFLVGSFLVYRLTSLNDRSAIAMVCILATYAVSWLSYHFVERPFLKLKKHFLYNHVLKA